ncbi:MAG: hypothetical protein SGILL_004834 [Bacillariaceae sp.]
MMFSVGSWWRAASMAAIILTSTVTAADATADPHLEEAKAIFEWVAGIDGGFVSPKQDIRRLVPGDVNTPLIVYAKETIMPGEVVMRVPWDTLIGSDDPDDGGQLPCGTVRNVAKEMKLGDDSKYAPYVNYLLSEADSQIPSAWTKPAQKLLNDVIGNNKIPPKNPTDWVRRWVSRCDGDINDKLAVKAALLIIQRSDDEIMIPAYDAYNHRNGNWTNTRTIEAEGKHHETTAIKTIEQGKEIYITYNQCEECGGRRNFYGSADIFRDYGFVEWLPQRWHYYMPKHYQFDLDEDEDGVLRLYWDKKHQPNNEEKKGKTRVWISRELQRLRRFKNMEWNLGFDKKGNGMTMYEWDTIWEFVDANVRALTMAYESITPSEEQEQEGTCTTEDAGEEGSCLSDLAKESHYDPLDWEEDDLAYNLYTCDTTDAFNQVGFELLEKTKSAYQLIKFKEKTETDDVCMNLDKIIQICANYRPHYHEYITHYAGRYIEDVRKVIFIGGGDSMLLHEALKYPNLELVVGLELDQVVTRKSFKYFNTQPHFDDPRVEWWFGDATKSLLLLPEEYWGSFDLVLVDLSETVMSLSVTDELDVFDALSLLLTPNGILVKNEVYLEKLSEVFDYTMELYYDSPVICSQTAALGSNNADFFHAPKYDHKLENFLYDNLHAADTHLDLMHDFRRNVAPDEVCNQTFEDEESGEQTRSAGIMEIVNAENAAVPADKTVLATLSQVVRKEGFHVIGEPLFENNVGLIMMKEGYLAVRPWQEERYIGLDINLWGHTYEIKSLKNALVKAIGSTKMYAYKVVVGGMFGSSTWKEDRKVLGPKSKQLRECKDDVVTEGLLDEAKAMAISAAELIPLTLTEHVAAIVFCGGEEETCPVFEALRGEDKVKTILRINECSGVEDDSLQDSYTCEFDVMSQVKEAIEKNGVKFNILAMDGSASYRMHQIVSSIVDTEANRYSFLEYHNIAMTWLSSDLADETWRRNFLDRYRKQVHHDPVSRAEIVFQADGKNHELGVVSTKNTRANYAFEELEKNIKSRLSDTGAHIELRWVHGGLFNYIEDFETKEFKHEDYDHSAARAQYESQVPLGSQHIFQLMKSEKHGREDLNLDMSGITGYLQAAFKVIQEPFQSKQFIGVGDGGVVVASSPSCNAIVLWDGREHVDINLFMFDESEKKAKAFADAFARASKQRLQVNLRDDQPRGIGGVVNFPSDLVDEEEE